MGFTDNNDYYELKTIKPVAYPITVWNVNNPDEKVVYPDAQAMRNAKTGKPALAAAMVVVRNEFD